MTILELMTQLQSATTISEAAHISINSGIAGAKDIYLAWGKERGDTVKELNEAWKEATPEKAKRAAGGFAADFYNWLAEESRAEEEAKAFIMGEDETYGDTSNNVKNHLTHYLNIWALAETVRSGETVLRSVSGGSKAKASSSTRQKAKAEPKDEWEYDDSHPFQDVRSAKENLKREMQRARPRKTRMHPDKVAHLNDEAITKQYTEAFKKFFG